VYDYTINEMVEGLRTRGLVREDQVDAARDALRDFWSGKIAVVWEVGDVLNACPGLTDDEAAEVLYKAFREHDAEHGIGWDTFETWAVRMYGERALEDDDEE
jgi:hypothetical protein